MTPALKGCFLSNLQPCVSSLLHIPILSGREAAARTICLDYGYSGSLKLESMQPLSSSVVQVFLSILLLMPGRKNAIHFISIQNDSAAFLAFENSGNFCMQLLAHMCRSAL